MSAAEKAGLAILRAARISLDDPDPDAELTFAQAVSAHTEGLDAADLRIAVFTVAMALAESLSSPREDDNHPRR